MGTWSIWHWLVVFLIVLPLWFFSRAVAKAGFSPWSVVWGIVPIVNIVMLWVFAYAKWPSLPDR